MYEGESKRVKSLCGETKDFRVKLGVHQDSALNPYLFSLVIDYMIKVTKGEI